MSAPLARLRARLLDHLGSDPRQPPLGGVGIFHSRRPQQLHNVPIHQPVAILILGGHKQYRLGERTGQIGPGQLLLLPAGCTVAIGNHPGADGSDYLALTIGFATETLQRYRRDFAAAYSDATAPLWQAHAPDDFIAALAQWVEWCLAHGADPAIATHRQVELLMLLARAGVAGNLLLQREAAWRERVAQIISLDPAHPWSASEVSRRLNLGESTLRRRLAEEQTGLRELLEEVRLVAGLALLQETFWPVGQVAEAVGYSSQSRFSERFRRRFGLSPSALKRTRETPRRAVEEKARALGAN